MIKSTDISNAHQIALKVFAGLMLASSAFSFLFPQLSWFGAAVAFASLFGMLVIYWNIGALRARFILMFAVVLIAMAVWGLLFVQT
ncbi:MAG: hypothetical protein HOP06_01140 [Methylotenera sp.]|nr:hypothetical protein [Methylotenera sp.]